MRRVHLVELEDLPWFPRLLRDAGTAYLEFAARMSGHSALLAPELERVLRASGAKQVVDLCSGGGGPVVAIAEELARRGERVEVTLTDFYPNLPAFERIRASSDGRVSFRAEPVDATRVPAELAGLRTIFNAFHHFRPASAARILGAAADARQPIAVFEMRWPCPSCGRSAGPGCRSRTWCPCCRCSCCGTGWSRACACTCPTTCAS